MNLLSAGGDDLLFVTDDGGDEQYQLTTVNATTGAMKVVGSQPVVIYNFGSWSPDGRWLVTAWGARWLYVRADGRRVRTGQGRGVPLDWAG